MSTPADFDCSSLGVYGIREFSACAQRLNGGKQNGRFPYLGVCAVGTFFEIFLVTENVNWLRSSVHRRSEFGSTERYASKYRM